MFLIAFKNTLKIGQPFRKYKSLLQEGVYFPKSELTLMDVLSVIVLQKFDCLWKYEGM